MGTDPEPDHTIGNGNTKGAVTDSDADRPVLSNLLEMQGRMPRIEFQ